MSYRDSVKYSEIEEAVRVTGTETGLRVYGGFLSHLAEGEEVDGELAGGERSGNTIEVYRHAVKSLLRFMDENGFGELNYSVKCAWKQKQKEMIDGGQIKVATANVRIIALNGLFKWFGLNPKWRMRPFRNKNGMTLENVLTLDEYKSLIRACDTLTERSLADHEEDLALKSRGELKGRVRRVRVWDREKAIMQTLFYTGIRISELRYVTVEALKAGRMTVTCKGSTRVVPLVGGLTEVLDGYCQKNGVTSGAVFVNAKGRPIPPNTVRTAFEKVAGAAGVPKEKVHPHSFRHLAAKVMERNGMPLSNIQLVLGHSSIETVVKYYTKPTIEELSANMDQFLR